jgi:hypothetical protein
VTVSFRPIGYIARDRIGGSYVRKRTPAKVEACVRAYVDAKFRAREKVQLRARLWPGVTWSFHLVHGVVRYPHELEAFTQEGVTCHSFHQLLSDLSRPGAHSFSGSAGGDLAEIVSYYKTHTTGDA